MYALGYLTISPYPETTHFFQTEKFDTARFELHQLLAQPTLKGVPLLVVRPSAISLIIVHALTLSTARQ